MTPDQISARLTEIFPNLDWTAKSYPHHTEHDGRARDEQGTPVISITHWNANAGFHANRVDIELLGRPRPQFIDITSALDWLEWFQRVTGK